MDKAFTIQQLETLKTHFAMNTNALADFLEMPRKTIYNYTVGRSSPNAEFMAALYGAGVSMDWFISGAGAVMRDAVKDSPGRNDAGEMPSRAAVYTWEDGGLVLMDDPFDYSIDDPVAMYRAAGYGPAIEVGNVEEGIGVGVLRCEKPNRWLVQVWIGGEVGFSVICVGGSGVTECLGYLRAGFGFRFESE